MSSLNRYYQVLENKEEQVRVVCLGDSNTELLYITGYYHNWVGWFTLGLCGADAWGRSRIMNSGLAGSTATDSLGRIDRDVIAYKPDLVIIEYGTNDQVSEKPSTTRESLITMVQSIQAGCPGVSILMRTPAPLYQATPDGKGEWNNTTAMVETVDAIREVATQLNLDLVDHFKIWNMPNQRRPPAFWMWDSFHPGPRGHRRFYEDMYDILKLPRNPLTPPPGWG